MVVMHQKANRQDSLFFFHVSEVIQIMYKNFFHTTQHPLNLKIRKEAYLIIFWTSDETNIC